VIQTYFILIGIFSVLWWTQIFILAGLLKIGVPPFHSWLIQILKRQNSTVFVIITTLHKLAPVMLLISLLLHATMWPFITGLILRVLLIGSSVDFSLILIFSSLSHTIWMLLRSVVRMGLVLFYWLSYSILTIILLEFKSKVEYFLVSKGSLLRTYWLIVSGIPPFVMFFIKIHIINRLIMFYFWVCFIILILVVFSIMAYYRVFRTSFVTRDRHFRLSSPILSSMALVLAL
jgi:NADH:ubiquinone oxidoreductase subunit 2 (subunit N)